MTIHNHKGSSLLEAILAMALFALLATSIVSLTGGSQLSAQRSQEYVKAQGIADEAVEALYALSHDGINELSVSTGAITVQNGEWILGTEGSTEVIENFTRTISYEDVCRDAQGAIAACPAERVDPFLKRASVRVSWPIMVVKTASITREVIISTWRGNDWTQTDWQGGSGQAIWNATDAYDSDDENVDVSVAGSLSLQETAGNSSTASCGTITFDYEDSNAYSYDTSLIEVAGGVASLKNLSSGSGIEWWDNAYNSREIVEVTTGPMLPSGGYNGYSVKLTYNTEQHVLAGEMQADCDDLRIVYWNGQTNTELDRWVTGCNQINSNIVFQLQADIPVDTTVTSSYYLYYEDPLAVNPPSNKANIFLWYDEVLADSSATYINGRADAWHGNGGTQSMTYNAGGYFSYDTGDNATESWRIPAGIASERDAYIEAEFYHTDAYKNDMSTGLIGRYIASADYGTTNENPTQYYASCRADSVFQNGAYNEDGDIVAGKRTTTVIDGPLQGPITSTQWRRVALALWGGATTAGKYWDSNLSAAMGMQGWPSIAPIASGTHASDFTGAGEWGTIMAQDQGRIRNILLRRYVSPEPAVSVTAAGAASYADTSPAISADPVAVTDVAAWTSFSEVATKNGGELYYQLSADGGTTWQYWDGNNWVLAGNTDYVSAATVASAIADFPTTTNGLSVKAFLSGDGTQQVQLDEVSIHCEKEASWDFNSAADYSYDNQQILVTSSVAQLISTAGGDLTGVTPSIIDSLEHDTSSGIHRDSIHISGDTYADVYYGPGGDGFVKTVSIDANGLISNSVIDSLEFDSSDAIYPSITHVTGDLYAIAYQGTRNDGFIVTLTIDNQGAISDSVIDSLEFDTGNGRNPEIVMVDTDTALIAYRGDGSDGFVKTIDIASNGQLSPVINTFEFDPSQADDVFLFQVGDGVFAVAYEGVGGDGFLATFSVADDGTIGNSVIDTLEFDTGDGAWSYVLPIANDIYGIVYQGVGSDGWVATVQIDANGIISNNIIDSLEFNSDDAVEPRMVYIEDTYYAIAYEGTNSDGFLTIVSIADTGVIADAVIDTFEYDTDNGESPDLFRIGTDYISIFYGGAGSDGFVATIEISRTAASYPNTGPSIAPSQATSIANLQQYTGFDEIAIKNGGEIYYQLSDDNGGSWQYWSGATWAAAGVSDYSTASEINTHITTFATSSNSFLFKAFLVSDGTQDVRLDRVSIQWGEIASTTVGGGGAYQEQGWVQSSAFFASPSAYEAVRWTETSNCGNDCSVQIQIRVAPDNGGTPGVFTNWYGANGAGSYFTDPLGSRLPEILNGNEWIQYRVELSGDGQHTPVVEDIAITYQ